MNGFPRKAWEQENYGISPLNNQQRQKKPRGEKKIMNKGQDRDEIRQIQMLMFLCMCLSPQSKLRELLEMALAASETETMAKAQATPCDDVSVDGLFTWLGSVFTQGDLTESQKQLLEWQNDDRNMLPAIDELKTIESKLGFKISIQEKN
ncbi:MAG: DurN family substrate-assisted peptide maturase [Heteroscytonema crispum UTEX LB 1556]